MNYTILKNIVAKARFELSTDSSSRILASARGKSARCAREFSSAKCHDKAGSKIIHGCGVGNTSRPGRSTSPAAQSTELKTLPR